MQGIIVHGCIRDSEDIGRMPLGVKALATHPLKSAKRDPGLRDVPVTIGGVPVSVLEYHLGCATLSVPCTYECASNASMHACMWCIAQSSLCQAAALHDFVFSVTLTR